VPASQARRRKDTLRVPPRYIPIHTAGTLSIGISRVRRRKGAKGAKGRSKGRAWVGSRFVAYASNQAMSARLYFTLASEDKVKVYGASTLIKDETLTEEEIIRNKKALFREALKQIYKFCRRYKRGYWCREVEFDPKLLTGIIAEIVESEAQQKPQTSRDTAPHSSI